MYVKWTRQTGRGDRSGETPDEVAEYFLSSFQEYFDVLGVQRDAICSYLADKVLVEYGPGDLPGVALLMIAFGAAQVVCVDRFPLVGFSPFAAATIESLRGRLPTDARRRVDQVLRGSTSGANGFDERHLQYRVMRDGLCGLRSRADLVFSRAVLEHVNDLAATFADMAAALRPTGVAIHLVDLKSHGLHQQSPLDFLAWPTWLWSLMYSAKGVPNRWRIDRYRHELAACGLEMQQLRPVGTYSSAEIAAARPHLAPEFRSLSEEDLAPKGFWLVCRKPG